MQAQFTMRSIHEVQRMQPWCSMLQPELLDRLNPSEDSAIVRYSLQLRERSQYKFALQLRHRGPGSHRCLPLLAAHSCNMRC